MLLMFEDSEVANAGLRRWDDPMIENWSEMKIT